MTTPKSIFKFHINKKLKTSFCESLSNPVFNMLSFYCHCIMSGDPTTFGNLQPANEILDAMKQVIDEKNFNGYAPSVGFIEAREAVAEYSG